MKTQLDLIRFTKKHNALKSLNIILILNLFSFLIFHACFDKLDAPPLCFEAPEEVSYSFETMKLRYQQGYSNYCAIEGQSCLELWSGKTKRELVSQPEYSFLYPYLVLLEKEPVSLNSPYSLCRLSECELPNCECETHKDCAGNTVCIAKNLDEFADQQTKTRCIPICTSDSICNENAHLTHCEAEDCMVLKR